MPWEKYFSFDKATRPFPSSIALEKFENTYELLDETIDASPISARRVSEFSPSRDK